MNQIHRFKINKLIRDRMPDIMTAQGCTVVQREMGTEEYIQRLKEKLLEEGREVLEARTVDEHLEELADVLEVLRALCDAKQIAMGEVQARRMNKRAAKGGFEQRVFGEYVEMGADNAALEFYRGRLEEMNSCSVDGN